LGSTLARHEWKGLSKMLNSLPDWKEKQKQEAAERESVRRSPRLNRRMPGTYALLDDDGEDSDDEDYVG